MQGLEINLSSAILWWEEWQLRILVLGSLFVQYVLFFSAPYRKHTIPSWFRSIIWLAYLGSDALAIYALATLFNRQARQDCNSGKENSILEVVWAPVLLMHLGGQDCITAYNIEDNELWRRHVLTAVCQVTVAIYVFCRSWPGGDKRLLQAAIVLFTPGILKCLEKPWALKSASFYSLVCLCDPARLHPWMTRLAARRSMMASRTGKAISLEEYVQNAWAFVQADRHHQAQKIGSVADLEPNHVSQAQGEVNEVDLEGNHVHQSQREGDEVSFQNQNGEERKQLKLETCKLFVDLASSYSDRLSILKSFLVYGDGKEAYASLQEGLFNIFDLLYTKEKMVVTFQRAALEEDDLRLKDVFPFYVRGAAFYLPFVAIGLFHKSCREIYNSNDVKVTYGLFSCTAALELFSMMSRMLQPRLCGNQLSGMVSQYSLIGFFASNKTHSKKMCSSSFRITTLVLGHVKGWRKEHITDAASYRRFSDHRGQWIIHHKGCDQDLGWSLNRPFDESVLLWHIATDLCFYQKGGTSVSHDKAMGCREISNYIIYLLIVNPEMVLPGTRQYLFMEATAELQEILEDDKPTIRSILKGNKPSPKDILKGSNSFLKCLKGKRSSPEEIERGLVQRIIAKLQPSESREGAAGCMESLPDAEKYPTAQEGFIHDGWKISEALLALGDEKKMWEVIEGVWVEMLCFSASRCRGYLHAKSLGTGPQLLTYVWLLLSRMGMETLPERLQRIELSSGGGNTGVAPSTSYVSTATAEDIV
uniref:Uncharacterized protein n=1 Tax=Avena sativa TaxID=4498 RepID=A0ACD5XT58_AVESA